MFRAPEMGVSDWVFRCVALAFISSKHFQATWGTFRHMALFLNRRSGMGVWWVGVF